MRSTVRAALLTLALASITLAQDKADPFLPERILPQNALLYLSIPQSASISEDYAKSNLSRLWNHPEVRGFIGSFESWWKKRKTQPTLVGGQAMPSFNDRCKAMTGLTIDEIWELLQGPLSFAVYDVPASEQHKLDLVLSLGASDGARLEKAAAALKENFKHGAVTEGEFSRGGTVIHEFGDNAFRIYYAVLQKTLFVATRQDRMEQIVDAAGNKTFAGLQEDPAFKAARTRVAGDNRHFFLLFANLGQTFKQFRRELGDELLRALETLGVSDISSLAASLGYDGPVIRERYAMLTARQDRGILKFLSGGTPTDPVAALVPAGSVSYSHLGLNLAEMYDVLIAASKISPEFEQNVQGVLGEYEKRVGFKVRDAFATVGSSWTSWSIPAPGATPLLADAIYSVALNDAAAFDAALQKAAKDAGLPLDELSFHGKKVRYLSFPFQDLGPLLPGFLPELKLTTTFSFLIENKTLFVSNHPMALKRLILRLENPGRSIAEDPKYAAISARVPATERESWDYTDLGRVAVSLYGLLEPFAHLVRDMARDPETGEMVADLALLPLEETIADLIGPSFATKKTSPDALVIESRSNVGVSLTSGVGFIGVAAAIAVPTILRMTGGGGMPAGPADNERIAEISLQFIRQAEDTFKNSDSDANGVADFWTRDVAGLYGLKDRSGQAIFLLDPATAAADPEGASRYGLTPAPKNGYFYRMLVTDPDGETYQKDDRKTHKTRYGVVSYPAAYGATGRFTFITNEAGKTWKKDTMGKPVDRWPGKDPAADGWTLAE